MANHTTADIRNIALVGHAGSGKTTLVERLLAATGTIGRMGTVEEGNTVADFEPEEKAHRHSLNSAIVHFGHKGAQVNLIDTPGYPDFIGQAISVLPAAGTTLIVVDAQKGIENVTRRMMRVAADEKRPRAIVVNKIDHTSDLSGLVNALRASFGKECIPANLPTKGGTGVVSVFDKADGEADFSSVEEAHTALVDQAVEIDEALMEKYLEAGEVAHDDLVHAYTRAMREGHLVPIYFVSAKTGAGVPELLDAIVEQMPSPLEANPWPFLVRESEDAEETEFIAQADPSKPFLAHVFRVTSDPFVGKLAAFRIHQGTLKSGDSVHIGQQRKPVRIAHIFRLQGKEHVEVHEAIPGDIVAVAKIEEMHYDAAMHNGFNVASIRPRPMALPQPMFGLALTPTKRGDEAKINQALSRLADEDPTLRIQRDQSTNELVTRGMGELHLRVVMEKLKNRFNVEVETKPPKIAYKETISAKAEGHHRHKKQTGGAGQFGEVYLRVEPLPADAEESFEFVDDTFGGSVPKQFMPAIEKGVRQVLETGAIAGYPMGGVRVSVYDGKHHPVDSKEVAFTTAGRRAFLDAVQKAKPVILEPFVRMEITVPQDYMGDITADLSGRRGRIQGTDMLPGGQAVITAVAPLAEVMTYASALKAMTQGTGAYSMEYSHYEPAPANVQAEIVAAYKPHEEED